MNERPIRVLVVDDSATFRRALSQLIEAQPDMELLETAATGHEAVRRATELQPDITLMDIHMPDMDGIQAAWLVSSKAPHGAVIMVTSEERVDFLQKAMTAGAQGYILKPFGDGAVLLQTVRDVSERTRARRLEPGGAAAPASARPRLGKRIAVFGTKGGLGKTALAVGLALALREQTQSSTILFDADFLFGDVNIHLDLVPKYSILDLLPHIGSLDSRLLESVIAHHPAGVNLLARPPRPEQAETINAEHVRAVLSVLATTHDYVVIDTQPSYDERMLAVLDLADMYVVVLAPSLGCLRNTRHFLDVARTLGYREDRMCFVLNRADSTAGLVLDDIASVLGTRRIFQLPSAGLAHTEAINRGLPLIIDEPRARYSRALATIVDHVRVLASGVEPRSR